MIVSVIVMFGIYLAYMTVSSDDVEVSMYVRTSGKKIALGFHQDRRSGNVYDSVSIEFSFFVLFLSFVFTRYKT